MLDFWYFCRKTNFLVRFLRIHPVQSVVNIITQLSGRGFPRIFYMKLFLSQLYVFWCSQMEARPCNSKDSLCIVMFGERSPNIMYSDVSKHHYTQWILWFWGSESKDSLCIVMFGEALKNTRSECWLSAVPWAAGPCQRNGTLGGQAFHRDLAPKPK